MVSFFFPMVGDFYFTALKQNILKSILLPTKRFFLDLWWLLFPKVKFLFSCYPWQAPRQPVSCPFCFVAVWQQYLLPRLQLYWHSWAEGIHFTFTLPSPKSAWCCAIYIIYHLYHDSKTTQGWLQHYPGWEENDFFFFFFFFPVSLFPSHCLSWWKHSVHENHPTCLITFVRTLTRQQPEAYFYACFCAMAHLNLLSSV